MKTYMNVHSGLNGSATLLLWHNWWLYLEISGKLGKDFKATCLHCGRVFWWHMVGIRVLEGEKVDVETLVGGYLNNLDSGR